MCSRQSPCCRRKARYSRAFACLHASARPSSTGTNCHMRCERRARIGVRCIPAAFILLRQTSWTCISRRNMRPDDNFRLQSHRTRPAPTRRMARADNVPAFMGGEWDSRINLPVAYPRASKLFHLRYCSGLSELKQQQCDAA